jgi:enoyl-[acyl-carrier-protein] reductase (NADH)
VTSQGATLRPAPIAAGGRQLGRGARKEFSYLAVSATKTLARARQASRGPFNAMAHAGVSQLSRLVKRVENLVVFRELNSISKRQNSGGF